MVYFKKEQFRLIQIVILFKHPLFQCGVLLYNRSVVNIKNKEVTMSLLITGGAGFIGGNYINWHLQQYPNDEIVCLDKLTYAANMAALADVVKLNNFTFIQGDICDEQFVESCFAQYKFDAVINFAAESHVDTSIISPAIFTKTNVEGTGVLLDACVKFAVERFHQISTDEVYGDKPLDYDWRGFTEASPLQPSSPYAASKASADLLCLAYARTYNLNVTVSRSSNNYGKWQHTEKLLSKIISLAEHGQKVPVYGSGLNKRDWLYVLDHCVAVDKIIRHGKAGHIYNVAAGTEMSNLTFIKLVLKILAKDENAIEFTEDRAGHDLRYPMDCEKIKNELDWTPQYAFKEALDETVAWYRSRML